VNGHLPDKGGYLALQLLGKKANSSSAFNFLCPCPDERPIARWAAAKGGGDRIVEDGAADVGDWES